MDRISMIIGTLLVALGAGGFIASGSVHPTALIPAYFGVGLASLGLQVMIRPHLRMHVMHAAATLALLGFIGSAVMFIRAVTHGAASTIKLVSQGGMAVLCALFLLLAVRSFIAARKSRVTANPA